MNKTKILIFFPGGYGSAFKEKELEDIQNSKLKIYPVFQQNLDCALKNGYKVLILNYPGEDIYNFGANSDN